MRVGERFSGAVLSDGVPNGGIGVRGRRLRTRRLRSLRSRQKTRQTRIGARASAAIAATTLHLVSAQPKPVNKRHVAVTEGSGIVVACGPIAHVGLNGAIS